MLVWTSIVWTSIIATTRAASWESVDDPTVAGLGGWTHEVELGDLDADGDLDVILVNGGDYSNAGADESSWWLQNDGTGSFLAVELVVGQHRTAKIRDFDADGAPDVFLPGAWQTPSVLLFGDGAGGLTDGSAGLPDELLAVGDAEAGDVDGDGDLDLVLSDSGTQNALFSQGEPMRLWLNDGAGAFTDATETAMPEKAVRWSWDIELMDIDLDYDLDLLVSCKTCTGSSVYTNDGAGVFTDRSASALPQPRSNNYDFESLDLTGDGLPDLVTINDGQGLDERILVNDGVGAFQDETATRLPPAENLGADDNVLVMLDPDLDGDIDVLVGSLSGADRLLVNDGAGNFTTDTEVIDGPATPGTLGLAVGDLDGDHKPDLVMAQGEAATTDIWYRGVDVPADTEGPFVQSPVGLPVDNAPAWPLLVQLQAHDRKTPVVPDDLVVTVDWAVGDDSGEIALHHAGGTLWRALVDGLPAGEGTAHTCATDRAGNTACSEDIPFGASAPDDTGLPDTGNTGTDGTATEDTGSGYTDDTPPQDEGKGCGCQTSAPPWTGAWAGAWAVAAVMLRRARRRAAG